MKNRVVESLVLPDERTDASRSRETHDLLDLITEGKSPHSISVGSVIVGKFAGFDDTGNPLVNFVHDISYENVLARTMIALRKNQVGSDVVLAFEYGNLDKPVITGMVWQPESSLLQNSLEVELDGRRITLTAEKEIVLRCGKASITLTQAGKVLIRGAYLSSHSSGVNRIKGGSVQIN
jgi:hypothetical protein